MALDQSMSRNIEAMQRERDAALRYFELTVSTYKKAHFENQEFGAALCETLDRLLFAATNATIPDLTGCRKDVAAFIASAHHLTDAYDKVLVASRPLPAPYVTDRGPTFVSSLNPAAQPFVPQKLKDTSSRTGPSAAAVSAQPEPELEPEPNVIEASPAVEEPHRSPEVSDLPASTQTSARDKPGVVTNADSEPIVVDSSNAEQLSDWTTTVVNRLIVGFEPKTANWGKPKPTAKTDEPTRLIFKRMESVFGKLSVAQKGKEKAEVDKQAQEVSAKETSAISEFSRASRVLLPESQEVVPGEVPQQPPFENQIEPAVEMFPLTDAAEAKALAINRQAPTLETESASGQSQSTFPDREIWFKSLREGLLSGGIAPEAVNMSLRVFADAIDKPQASLNLAALSASWPMEKSLSQFFEWRATVSPPLVRLIAPGGYGEIPAWAPKSPHLEELYLPDVAPAHRLAVVQNPDWEREPLREPPLVEPHNLPHAAKSFDGEQFSLSATRCSRLRRLVVACLDDNDVNAHKTVPSLRSTEGCVIVSLDPRKFKVGDELVFTTKQWRWVALQLGESCTSVTLMPAKDSTPIAAFRRRCVDVGIAAQGNALQLQVEAAVDKIYSSFYWNTGPLDLSDCPAPAIDFIKKRGLLDAFAEACRTPRSCVRFDKATNTVSRQLLAAPTSEVGSNPGESQPTFPGRDAWLKEVRGALELKGIQQEKIEMCIQVLADAVDHPRSSLDLGALRADWPIVDQITRFFDWRATVLPPLERLIAESGRAGVPKYVAKNTPDLQELYLPELRPRRRVESAKTLKWTKEPRHKPPFASPLSREYTEKLKALYAAKAIDQETFELWVEKSPKLQKLVVACLADADLDPDKTHLTMVRADSGDPALVFMPCVKMNGAEKVFAASRERGLILGFTPEIRSVSVTLLPSSDSAHVSAFRDSCGNVALSAAGEPCQAEVIRAVNMIFSAFYWDFDVVDLSGFSSKAIKFIKDSRLVDDFLSARNGRTCVRFDKESGNLSRRAIETSQLQLKMPTE